MPTISVRTSVAANATSANVLAGSPFEFVAQQSVVRLAVTQAGAAPDDVTANFQIGGESIVNAGNISNRSAFPTFRDDQFAMAGAVAGERLFLSYSNTTIGALNVDTLIEVTAL